MPMETHLTLVMNVGARTDVLGQWTSIVPAVLKSCMLSLDVCVLRSLDS